MRERIVYPLGEGVAVITPLECGLTVEQIAAKDTPAGVPYLIVDATDVPTDRTYRAAWRADFSQPDGHGLTPEEWQAAYGQPEPPAPEPEPMPERPPDPLPHEIAANDQRLP